MHALYCVFKEERIKVSPKEHRKEKEDKKEVVLINQNKKDGEAVLTKEKVDGEDKYIIYRNGWYLGHIGDQESLGAIYNKKYTRFTTDGCYLITPNYSYDSVVIRNIGRKKERVVSMPAQLRNISIYRKETPSFYVVEHELKIEDTNNNKVKILLEAIDFSLNLPLDKKDRAWLEKSSSSKNTLSSKKSQSL